MEKSILADFLQIKVKLCEFVRLEQRRLLGYVGAGSSYVSYQSTAYSSNLKKECTVDEVIQFLCKQEKRKKFRT